MRRLSPQAAAQLERLAGLCERLRRERDDAVKRVAELEAFERDFDMYRRAWIRELGGKLIRKTHEIDALVLTTRKLKEDTRREVLRDCSKALLASVTRTDVVALAEGWAAVAKLEGS